MRVGNVDRLVSVGNVMVDITAHLDQLPQRGGDVLADESAITPGGSFNLLVAARRQGLRAAYAGAHGTGPFGDLVRAALAADSVEVLLQPTPGSDTGYDIALIDGGGERTFVTAFGAEATLDPAQLAGLRMRAGDAVHVSGYGLLARTNAAVLEPWLAILDPGQLVIFDPGPLVADLEPAALRQALQRSNWISCNEPEAAVLSGERDPAAAAAVMARFGGGVLVRLGAGGCLVQPAGERGHRIPAVPTDAVDTNGAGDAHTGAFVAALAARLAPEEAAYRANAAAALAVSRRGPATAPTRAETDRLIASATRTSAG
jgi:sugar/nucleoside kinase (ribokinase family)